MSLRKERIVREVFPGNPNAIIGHESRLVATGCQGKVVSFSQFILIRSPGWPQLVQVGPVCQKGGR